MKKLHEMFPIIFKKPEKVSKELLSFEDWFEKKLTKKFNEKYSSGRWIYPDLPTGDFNDIHIGYDEYVKEFTQNNREQKINDILNEN